MKRMILVPAVLLVCTVCPAMAAERAVKPGVLPENLAPKAKATASSEYSDSYLARFAVT